MAAPRDLRGSPASPGRALGPVHRAEERSVPLPGAPGEGDARAALAAAVTVAVAELGELSARSDAESAGILDFQIELLLDGELTAPAFARIGRGEAAALAWAGAMNAHIDTLATDGDAFALRAADLADLKNRVLDALAGRTRADFPQGAVYVGRDMPPSAFLAHDWSAGGAIALTAGSAASHVALLARSRGVPMVVGLGALPAEPGDTALVDGTQGVVRLHPEERLDAPPAHLVAGADRAPAARLGAGGRYAGETGAAETGPVRLFANIDTLADLDALDPAGVAGVGLVRTEFLLSDAAEALNEERHLACYRRIVERLGGRPATLRMLDLGGDKAMPGLVEGDPASVLGARGVRFLLAHPDLARIQARALIRAAALGPVNVLLPMVTLPAELAAMARLFDEEAARLARRGVPARRPPLGIMVEVPAAALTLDLFGAAAFFSVGTNDLMQYLAAAARDNPAVAHLYAGAEAAMFRLLDQIAVAARALGRPVSVCGDLAGDPAAVGRLVALGLRDLSMAPARLGAVRAAIEGLGEGSGEGAPG
ncbi:putative PEP-binding protein [Ancylobacter sp. TS-1]|uniref:putative PEP-binding protein n=1 Tax=Ancylobacter sp. TS-1 TaxID=1850374 RepID=UPI001265BF30|nr:putative PEP-binding protein [Ancylobacter sp. TS-1]QFR34208.1 phosphoenolpyruvate--protein phosphotransferase [Ancylobacter sp. TS-1]